MIGGTKSCECFLTRYVQPNFSTAPHCMMPAIAFAVSCRLTDLPEGAWKISRKFLRFWGSVYPGACTLFRGPPEDHFVNFVGLLLGQPTPEGKTQHPLFLLSLIVRHSSAAASSRCLQKQFQKVNRKTRDHARLHAFRNSRGRDPARRKNRSAERTQTCQT